MTDHDVTTEQTCLYCLEPMRAGARRCPRCRSWQSRWAADAQNPGLELLLLFLGVATAIALLVWWGRLADQGAPTPNPAASIEVVGARAVPEGDGVAWVGTLRNSADVTWRNLYFHAECVDESGVVVDVIDVRNPWVVLAPLADSRFKVVYSRLRLPPEEYEDCRLEVRLADPVLPRR
jgi:hypothetical protein